MKYRKFGGKSEKESKKKVYCAPIHLSQKDRENGGKNETSDAFKLKTKTQLNEKRRAASCAAPCWDKEQADISAGYRRSRPASPVSLRDFSGAAELSLKSKRLKPGRSEIERMYSKRNAIRLEKLTQNLEADTAHQRKGKGKKWSIKLQDEDGGALCEKFLPRRITRVSSPPEEKKKVKCEKERGI